MAIINSKLSVVYLEEFLFYFGVFVHFELDSNWRNIVVATLYLKMQRMQLVCDDTMPFLLLYCGQYNIIHCLVLIRRKQCSGSVQFPTVFTIISIFKFISSFRAKTLQSTGSAFSCLTTEHSSSTMWPPGITLACHFIILLFSKRADGFRTK
jgi:hypothetical protein